MGDQVVRHNEQSVAENREITARERGVRRPTNDTAIFPILHCKQAARGVQPVHAAHIIYNNNINSTCPHNWLKAKPRRKQAGRAGAHHFSLSLSPSPALHFSGRITQSASSDCGNTMHCTQCMHCIAGARAVYDDGLWEVWSPHRAALEESCWVRVSTAEEKVQVCACMAAVDPIVDPAPTAHDTCVGPLHSCPHAV